MSALRMDIQTFFLLTQPNLPQIERAARFHYTVEGENFSQTVHHFCGYRDMAELKCLITNQEIVAEYLRLNNPDSMPEDGVSFTPEQIDVALLWFKDHYLSKCIEVIGEIE